MKKIILISKKEFLDILRDKRTLVRMILVPLIAFPLIMNVVTRLQASQNSKVAEKELTVGYWDNGSGESHLENMKKTDLFKFVAYSDTTELRQDVKQDKVSLGIAYHLDYDTKIEQGKQGDYSIFFRGADIEEFERFDKLLEKEDSLIVDTRMKIANQDYAYITPTNPIKKDTSEFKEVLAKYAGGILPYIFMAFLFLGCMLPAIDLFAGEKERGTIETLLTTPANRTEILVGKMLVVVFFGLLSATIALVGLFLSLNMLEAEGEFLKTVNEILSPTLILTLYVLLIPLAFFFAGVMIPISVYARSFKEAQSILTPLNIVMVLPAMAGFVPGLELDYTTAFIPIINVVLATKAIIGGNVDVVLIGITFLSLMILAALAVSISLFQFKKESMILR